MNEIDLSDPKAKEQMRSVPILSQKLVRGTLEISASLMITPRDLILKKHLSLSSRFTASCTFGRRVVL